MNHNIRLQSSILQTSNKYGYFITIYQLIYTKFYIPYVWKVLKYFIHLITGKSEIERICLYPYSRTLRALYLYNSIQRSTKLRLNDLSASSRSVSMTKDIIIDKKNIRSEKSIFNLNSCLTLFDDYNRMISDINTQRTCAYDRQNAEHEKYLEELWVHLKPNTQRSARITGEWEEIGFQGNDPATDFRGMGVLGLLNLLYFAKTYPTESKWVLKSFPYPFSITGINITVNLVFSRDISAHFFEYGSSLETFNELYCRIFYAFAKMSIESGETCIMTFPFVFSRFNDLLKRIIYQNNGIFKLPPSSPFEQGFELHEHKE